MSHTTSIKGIKLVNLQALQNAVAELKASGIRLEMVPNEIPRAFYPNQPGMGLADFVIKVADAPYDIGLYKQEDGSYEPRTDFFAGYIEKLLGVKPTKPENKDQAKLGKLTQMYGIHAATLQARMKGYTVRRVEGQDGAVKLVLNGFA